MLPDINLDNEVFDDILENARNSIVSTYPEWTDFNYHDPGMTMLEMFAWLKEIQQYYLNKIGPANISKYLKLLGVQRRTKRPSSTQVTVRYKDDLIAPEGTRLYAGDICFEVPQRTFVSSSRIECCICKSKNNKRVVEQQELSFGGNLKIRPFLEEKDSEFCIGFDKPLEEGEQHYLYIDVNDLGAVSRNPITDPGSFIPLADITTEYSDGAGWEALECEDGTYGFLCPGVIKFRLPHKHGKADVGGRTAYYIRFRMTGGEYDILPMIRGLEFNLLPVLQRETKAECRDYPVSDRINMLSDLATRGNTWVYLRNKDGMFIPAPSYEKAIDPTTGEISLTVSGAADAESVRVVNMDPDFTHDSEIGVGTGLPFQEYDLETDALEYDSFRLMTELPASGGKLVEWKKVPDFSAAKADDFVYVLDTAAGVIRFGDCIRGMAPEGRIFIVGCSLTLGADGNVSVGKIDRPGSFEDEDFTVTNTRRSEGGVNEESIENCCIRAYRLMQTTETLVTDEDYERFIMGVQGLKIETCHLMQANSTADGRSDPIRSIVVKPYTPDGRGIPGDRYCRNILSALESRRMLGTGFRIVKPEYAAVRVYADISVERSATNARQELEKAIRSYFEECNNRFGIKLIYSRLYERVDRLPFVISINTLTLETKGSGAERTREGDLLLAPNYTAHLSETALTLSAVR